MKDFDEDTWKEFWAALDEEERLTAELTEKSRAFDYVIGVEDFQRHVTFAFEKLKDVVEKLRCTDDERRALDGLREFSFYLFSLGSVHLSMENLFYCGACDLGVADTIHPILDDWKYSVSVQLMKAYRNRLQHRYYAVPNVKIESRTAHHPEGPGRNVDLSLSDAELEKLVEKVQAKDGLRDKCQSFLNTRVKGQPGGVMVLLEQYREDLSALIDKLKGTLCSTHSAEFEKMHDLIRKIDKTRETQRRHGFQNPLQPVIDIVEKFAREWTANG